MSCGIGAESGLYGVGLHHGYHFRWTSRSDHRFYLYPGLNINESLLMSLTVQRFDRTIGPYFGIGGGYQRYITVDKPSAIETRIYLKAIPPTPLMVPN